MRRDNLDPIQSCGTDVFRRCLKPFDDLCDHFNGHLTRHDVKAFVWHGRRCIGHRVRSICGHGHLASRMAELRENLAAFVVAGLR